MNETPNIPVHCRNCGEPITWTGHPPTGWTHGDPTNQQPAWQGKRCPGRITGAVPDTDRLTNEAYQAGYSALPRQVANALRTFRQERRTRPGAGWEQRVTDAAWQLAKAMDDAMPTDEAEHETTPTDGEQPS